MIVLGIDPGGASTGMAVRSGDELLSWNLLERDGVTRHEWVTAVVYAALRHHDNAIQHGPPVYVAVEDVQRPNPHLGLTNPTGLIDTAVIVGALLAAFPAVVLVPPARHGSLPIGMYPDALVGPTERRGAGKLRHVRSAWDIAAAGAARITWEQSTTRQKGQQRRDR